MALRAVLTAALVACASALEAQVDRGNVLVYKTVAFTQITEKSDAGLLERDVLVVGVPFKVTYLVFNLGKGDATDVKVKDAFPAASFELVEGAAEKSWPVLAGGANETFSVTLKAKAAGALKSTRATVDYKYLAAAELDEEDELVDVNSFSTLPGVGGVLTAVTPAAYSSSTASYSVETAVAAAGAIIAIAWPFKIWSSAKAVNDKRRA